MSSDILTSYRHQATHVVRRHPPVGFLLLAFGLSWGGGVVLNSIPLIAPDGLFIAGVLIAALAITGLSGGRAALADTGRRLLPRRVGARSYLVAFCLPVLLVGSAIAALPLVGGSAATWANRPELAQTAVLFLVVLLLP